MVAKRLGIDGWARGRSTRTGPRRPFNRLGSRLRARPRARAGLSLRQRETNQREGKTKDGQPAPFVRYHGIAFS